MADENSLDSFLNASSSQTQPTEPAKQENVNLEDEFTKLLNDFIKQDSPATTPTPATEQSTQPEPAQGLDSLITSAPAPSQGLDGMITTPKPSDAPSPIQPSAAVTESLDDMLSNATVPPSVNIPDEIASLKAEEQELARAVSNFQDGITAMAGTKNFKLPQTDYTANMLYPNYKPSVGKKIAAYLLECWDIINKYDPENMQRLSPEASDEDYLNFAESLSDTYLQLTIISYVEILINIEICEVNYEQKKELLIKNKIKKELYEEYMELQERKNAFIKKLKEKNFPIDVDRLINNYFKAAQKDADGAFDALTKNPAMFSPIEFEKIHPKFFGLIKVTPEDGIRANQKIGDFVKKLKV